MRRLNGNNPEDLREEDGGARSAAFAEELPEGGKEIDPRIVRLIKLLARQAARETVEAELQRPTPDDGGSKKAK